MLSGYIGQINYLVLAGNPKQDREETPAPNGLFDFHGAHRYITFCLFLEKA